MSKEGIVLASLIQELMNILEEETGCYQTLLDMADNKRDVIIQGDVPSLQEITKKEQELAGFLLRLEKKRQENVMDICQVTNRKPEDMTIQKLIDLLKGNEKNQLKETQEELLSVVEQLKSKNELNKKLIAQSLELLDFTMNAVQSMRSAPTSNNYQSRGTNYHDYQGKNFFDAKQ